jgi:DNA-binding GntR family transcriptional regulator
VISKINVARVKQEWFVRKTLEIAMTDAFFEHVTEADIDEMRLYAHTCEELGAQPMSHDTSYEYLVNDNRFHAVTYRVAKEGLAANIISSSMAHYNRVRLLVDLENTNKNRTITDHEQLLHYIEEGDKEGYRKSLTIHLERVIGDIEQLRVQAPDLFEL